MMSTEISKIDAPWAEKLTKTSVQFLMTPTVVLDQIMAAPIFAINVAYRIYWQILWPKFEWP